jgi:hypothetical protein
MHLTPIKNVYEPVLKGVMAYASDSTGRWRFGHPFDSDAFHNRRPIHLLTHPIWWTQEGSDPLLKLEAWLDRIRTIHLKDAREFLPTLIKL